MQKNKLNLHIYGIHLLNPYETVVSHLKLQQVSNMFETPEISRRQIALKIALGLHVRF